MAWRVELSPTAKREMAAPPIKFQFQISEKIESLRENPRPPGCKRLKTSPYHRVRSGDYRIVYQIKDKVLLVSVVRVGHRSHVYRRLPGA